MCKPIYILVVTSLLLNETINCLTKKQRDGKENLVDSGVESGHNTTGMGENLKRVSRCSLYQTMYISCLL